MKTALIITHYGTTHQILRDKVINRFQSELEKNFENLSIFQVYTSKLVRINLEKQGVITPSIEDIFNLLISENYKNIFIQPTYLSFGREMNNLIENLNKFKGRINFKIGAPLIHTIDDCFEIINIIDKENTIENPDEVIILVGHGSGNSSLSIYTTLDMVAKEVNKKIYVAVITGYPTLEIVLKRLKSQKVKIVKIVPLLFLAGQHLKKDIETVWKQRLTNEGFEVIIEEKSLGERTTILKMIERKIAMELKENENEK